MKIGIFGLGVVGTAVYNGLVKKNLVYRYDINGKYYDPEMVSRSSDIIFVCVPTPTIKGKQDLSYVKKAVETIEEYSANQRKTIVIKSTVLPGTTRSFATRFVYDTFIFNPEFLTARTANEDFLNQKQIILGGEKLDEVELLYKDSFPNIPIKRVSWETAEILKYTCNTFYATKVAFANTIYNACCKLDVDYNTVKELFIANGWVAPTHLDVPGPDGATGYGGACLPKDTKAFISWGEEHGLVMSVLRGAEQLNSKVKDE